MFETEVRVAVVALLSVVLLGSGCVTQSTFDELEAQRGELQAQNARLEGDVAMLRDENAVLTESLATAENALADSRLEVMSLTGTFDELVGELRQEVASGQIQIARVAEGISLNVSEELLFRSGEVQPNAAGRELLARVAQRIQSEESTVWVEGHTDDIRVGKRLRDRYPTNWELAAARATAVVRVLVDSGVAPTRMRAVSRGPFAPVAPNDTEASRAKNRRTEIILRPLVK